MNTLTTSGPSFTQDHRRLLGGWQDMLDDLRAVARTLRTLPDDSDECDALLAAVRLSLDALVADTSRFFPVIRVVAERHVQSGSAEAVAIERDITAIVATFQDIVVAAGPFRQGSLADHLHVLQERAAMLLIAANRLDRRFDAGE